MFLSNIKLKNFRGYQYLLLDFSCGINVFVGKNASGKTNLLEAIHYLSFTKSFKSVDDKELVKYNGDSFFINGVINKNNIKNDINIYFDKENKKILLNDKNLLKLSNLNSISNVIIFSPTDVNIFKTSPINRRMFLDLNISKLNTNYGEDLKNVSRLIKMRNEILKSEIINKIELGIITDELIKYQKNIIKVRIEFVEKINQIITKVSKEIKGDKDKIKIIYFPFINIDEKYEENAKKLYDQNLENDIKKKFTNIGIHHEDFMLLLNDKNIADVGSQGENRLLAISLKLSPYFLVENKEDHPIICLDDVLSELDDNHQERLIKFLRKFEQVFITTTSIKIKNANIYEIKNHLVKRR